MYRTLLWTTLGLAVWGTPNVAATEEGPELAVYMAAMQRHSHKLGRAIAAKNQVLAQFYLKELSEAVANTKKAVPVHDGLDIAKLIEIIAPPQVQGLKKSLANTPVNWPGVEKRYGKLIGSCNRCHAATEHGFIRIEAPSGPNPFNQSFEPAP